jgi:hypothetical protein
MRRALHRRKLRIARGSLWGAGRKPGIETHLFEHDRRRAERAEPPANARRIQRAILDGLSRDDRLRLEYIRWRWQNGQG